MCVGERELLENVLKEDVGLCFSGRLKQCCDMLVISSSLNALYHSFYMLFCKCWSSLFRGWPTLFAPPVRDGAFVILLGCNFQVMFSSHVFQQCYYEYTVFTAFISLPCCAFCGIGQDGCQSAKLNILVLLSHILQNLNLLVLEVFFLIAQFSDRNSSPTFILNFHCLVHLDSTLIDSHLVFHCT